MISKSRCATGLVTCSDCGKKDWKIKAERSGGQFVYRNKEGKAWSRRKCPECRIKIIAGHNAVRARKLKAAKLANPVPRRIAQCHVGYIAPGTKIYACKTCQAKTVNRYFCRSCLSKQEAGVGEAEFFAQGALV